MYVDGLSCRPEAKCRLPEDGRLGGKIGANTAPSNTWMRADDVQPGKLTSFPQAVKLKRRGRGVLLDHLQVARRPHRINAKVRRTAAGAVHGSKTLPFDGKRRFFGGFKQSSDVNAGLLPYRIHPEKEQIRH